MFSKKIVYVGVDVDDTAFHGAGIIRARRLHPTRW
jgi:hypothetical protein